MLGQCYNQVNQICYTDACLLSPGAPAQVSQCHRTLWMRRLWWVQNYLSGHLIHGGSNKNSSDELLGNNICVKGTYDCPVKTWSIVQSEVLLMTTWERKTDTEKEILLMSKRTKHLILAVFGITTPLNKMSLIHILNWQHLKGWHSFTCCLVHFQFM